MLWLWRIYALMIVWMSIASFAATGLHNILDYVNLAETVLELMGLTGFAFRFPTFNRVLWKVAFPCFVVWDVVIGLLQNPGWTWFAASIGMAIPMYIAIYHYAYRSEAMWEDKS